MFAREFNIFIAVVAGGLYGAGILTGVLGYWLAS
jgi:hypothetical protein